MNQRPRNDDHLPLRASGAAIRPWPVLFGVAALYNVLFGLWAACFPLAFFEAFALPPPNYPSIWGCLGMVVGLYGVLYAYVAWRPERGDLIVAIGLAGKVLGPIGWLVAVGRGELPPKTFPLVLFNDLVWWFPFLFYLLRNVPARRAIIAGITVVAHLAACLALLLARQGTEANPDWHSRAAWVAQSMSAWVVLWFLWAISSLSLLAFCVAWAAQLLELNAARRAAVGGCVLVGLGLIFDLTGEALQIGVATSSRLTTDRFQNVVRLYNLLGPAAANGLYCLGGLVLSRLSWRCGFLRGQIGAMGFVMWSVGLLLTLIAVADHRIGMLVTGAAVMILFLPFAAIVGWKMRFAGRAEARPPYC
jgi:hypothetical protein